MRKLLPIFIVYLLFAGNRLAAQPAGFSITTDLGIQRNFRKQQQFWAFGQTVQFQLHVTPKNSFYIWAAYFSNGKVNYAQTATAKSLTTLPQSIAYNNQSLIRFKHISMGGKHYFKGSAVQESGWNLYGLAGFGIILGRVINTFSTPVDSSRYTIPLQEGQANFKRLTIDVGLGWEKSLGGTIYVYNDFRFWVPTSDYPSPYLFVNNHAPLAGTVSLGVRILFD